MSERIPDTVKRIVATRANNICEYCRCLEDFSTQSFTVDHIKPRKVGGETILENLAWSCFGCNAYKHTKTEGIDPETKQKISLFNPRQQSWHDHFKWTEDKTEIIGKTPCGRATTLTLRLNRSGIVNLRTLLITVNLHPPK
jgi:5-methylcytosine-specific restriction endonuclease McrA